MKVLHTLEQVIQQRELLRSQQRSVALVPTMGALHKGHVSLLNCGLQYADCVWASIFVNPTQFGPSEDYSSYPRTLEADLAACKAAGCEAVWVPDVATMYPPGAPAVEMTVPAVAHDLEGSFRPTHFQGVCRVVAKLLCAVLPEVAVFGKKDYQQLRVIEAMSTDLLLPVRIIGAPTVHEQQGLALSSRNRYLDETQMQQALAISQALNQCQSAVESGETDIAVLEAKMCAQLEDASLQVDYATVRRRQDLTKLDKVVAGESVALITARCGNTRLLDNREM